MDCTPIVAETRPTPSQDRGRCDCLSPNHRCRSTHTTVIAGSHGSPDLQVNAVADEIHVPIHVEHVHPSGVVAGRAANANPQRGREFPTPGTAGSFHAAIGLAGIRGGDMV